MSALTTTAHTLYSGPARMMFVRGRELDFVQGALFCFRCFRFFVLSFPSVHERSTMRLALHTAVGWVKKNVVTVCVGGGDSVKGGCDY